MKKSLLAVAAIGAFASAAQAQSSVTVYGILDVGYIGSNVRTSATADGVKKTTTSQFGQSAEQTSRMGFKGTEDLGNGTSAFFTAEFQLQPQDQTLSGNSTNKDANNANAQSGGLLNRQTFVGLKKNGIGQTAVGLQYTPIFNAGAATSAGQYNNMLGDLVYAGSTTAGNNGGGATTAGFTSRTANTLSVQSDKFAGFSAGAMYTLNNSNSTETVTPTSTVAGAGGSTNASGWGLNADYTFNKFYITGAYQALKQLTTATNVGTPGAFTSTTTTVGATGVWTGAQPSSGIAGSAINIQDNQSFAGATYDFGILKAYAQWVSRKASSTINSGYYVKRSAEQIGVRSFITPVVEAWASVGTGRYTAYGTQQPTANFNGWQIGSNYLLSKRTNLYAIYGQQNFSNAATSTSTVSANANNYAIGVRHTF
ncbi:porin [Polynucleobacter sp. AP-Reno-20A-A9]|uniref:porin n=1 Tax=Polynucleobacter sp. AP-Reno-20A-A9 TaxID=2576925 RepID=UPI001C0E03B7|nr:porin [Polynucleobacter sp. AP-Reno-20A-A9]MBU3627444.1 porin [Polynucleobacter sp. AP-Reno-20A-A9]